MKLYGIPNCNTVKKAIDWLKANNISFEFHDYKKLGISREKLQQWTAGVGWEKLVNKKGTTWRTLSTDEQTAIKNEKTAIALMMDKNSVIKRPVIETGKQLLVGFVEAEYKHIFSEKK